MRRLRNAILIVGPGLRPDPCDGGAVLHRADVLDFGSDPHLRRGRPRRDADRALHRVAGAAAARRSPAAPRGRAWLRPGRRGDFGVEALRALLLLDRGAHGEAARDFTVCSASLVVASLGGVFVNLQPRYHLADQVPDKEQAVSASRSLDAKLTGSNPIDVLIEFPQGRVALCAGNARRHRAGSRHRRAAAGRRQRLVAGDAAPLAQPRKLGDSERRDPA